MSDLDDLQRLEQLLQEGRLTQQEYENERAWITGSTEAEYDALSQSQAHATPGSHVIDLHEIEAQEAAAEARATKAGKPDQARKAARSRSQDDTPRRRIPTVWRVILIAFLVWILLLATAVVYLRLRGTTSQPGFTQAAMQDTAGSQTQAGSEAAQSAAQDLQDNTTEATYDAFVTQLETTLGTYYGSNYSITDDGKTLTVSLMGEGIAADAMYVVQGADGAAEIWSELKSSMQALAMTCFDGANARAAERHVVLNILNDQNQENVILSYLDGTCIYDATETSDLSE